MKYGNIKFHAIEDGIGIRTVLFVSGCRNHCKNCFQPETWDFDYGKEFTEETEQIIINSMQDGYTTGLTLLGGEPFEPENQKVLRSFVEKIHALFPDKDIWAYSGYKFEDLAFENGKRHTEDTIPLLKCIDILVDGRFIEEKANKLLSYKGSSNQRIIDVKRSLPAERVILSEYNERRS